MPFILARLQTYGRQLRDSLAQLFNSETYTRTLLFKAALSWLAFIFWDQLVAFYDTTLVQPVLSLITSSTGNDFAFGLVSVLLLLWNAARIRRAYRLSILQIALCAGPGVLYLFGRGGEQWGHHWHFTSFAYRPRLYYADVLLVPLVGVVVLLLVARRRAQQPTPASATSGYLQEDAPTFTPDPARPEAYEAEARRLMVQLSALRPSRAYAVGIVGQWGSGKTRFLHLLQQHLPVGAICIQFNPWLVESTVAIRKEFFTTLKDGLGAYSGELAAELGTYATSLAEVADTTAVKAFKEVIALVAEQPTLSEQFANVNRVIGQLNRPIFVFLDDIDRLDKDEVLETLRIVRNTANFQHTVFMLAYDRAYVLEAVQRTNQANSSQYLDKIVQLEFVLPGFSAAALAERTLELILPHVKLIYRAELTNLISRRANQRPTHNWAEQYRSMSAEAGHRCYYPELITTMRAAVRFANLFTHDFLPLAGEVRLDELINLTLLKLRFPALYEIIKIRRAVTADMADTFSTGGAKMAVLEEALTAFFATSGLPHHEQQLATQVVKHLFSGGNIDANERTIRRPSSFDLYFSAGNFTNVSLVAIEQMRLGPATDIDRWLTQWQQADQLAEAFEVLKHIEEFNGHQDFENVVAAVLAAGRRLDLDAPIAAHWLLALAARHRKLATQLYDGQQDLLVSWFTTLFATAPAPHVYEAELIKELQLESRVTNTPDFWVPSDTLRNIALGYLVEHVMVHPVVDYEAFDLHWGTVYSVDNQNNVLTDERANTIMREAIQNNQLRAIPALVKFTDRALNRRVYWFQPLLNRIFSSWENFQQFLQKLPPSPETTRIQEDFKYYQLAGYQEFSRPQGKPK